MLKKIISLLSILQSWFLVGCGDGKETAMFELKEIKKVELKDMTLGTNDHGVISKVLN